MKDYINILEFTTHIIAIVAGYGLTFLLVIWGIVRLIDRLIKWVMDFTGATRMLIDWLKHKKEFQRFMVRKREQEEGGFDFIVP